MDLTSSSLQMLVLTSSSDKRSLQIVLCRVMMLPRVRYSGSMHTQNIHEARVHLHYLSYLEYRNSLEGPGIVGKYNIELYI
jgi:hypothetical protein